MLQSQGFEVNASAFKRDYHKGRVPDCHVNYLGTLGKGRYARRLWTYIRTIPLLRTQTRHSDVIYAFGLDLALLALICNLTRKKVLVLEVGDIRRIQVRQNWQGRVMRLVSQWLYHHCNLLIVTAKEFATDYYSAGKPPPVPYLVIENKLEMGEAKLKNSATEPLQSEAILRIGYFGLLRSEWSYAVLGEYARRNPDSVRILVAGAVQEGQQSFEDFISLQNVEYFGPYKSPQDLPELYGQVDLVWGCYPEPEPLDAKPNPAWTWAQSVCRSNRFYESCYYRVPVISMANSGDGKVVDACTLGPVLSSDHYEYIEARLNSITRQSMVAWRQNIENLPESVYCYTNEDKLLATAIKRCINATVAE